MEVATINQDEEDTEENAEWKDNVSGEPANKSHTDEENDSDNKDDGGAANTTEEEIDEPTEEKF
jgi:hypothetical protein